MRTAGGSLGAETRASEERAVVAVLVGTRGAVFGQDSLNPTVFLMGKVKVAQSRPTLCNPIDWSIDSWIFPTQESNWSLLHCRWILYQLGYQGSPCLRRSHRGCSVASMGPPLSLEGAQAPAPCLQPTWPEVTFPGAPGKMRVRGSEEEPLCPLVMGRCQWTLENVFRKQQRLDLTVK